jgi:hypothetical protein
MNQTRAQQIEREAAKRRRSGWVTIGVAAAIVIGAPVLFYQCSEDEDPVVEGQAYANNHYVPGVGYYHAGYHGFFPLPFNYYDAGRGSYFSGGNWGSRPDTTRNLTSSVPSRSTVASANNQFRSTQASTRGGFGRSGSFFSGRS